MTDAQIAEMTVRYAFLGVIAGGVIAVLGGLLTTWLTRRFNRSHADEQIDRDLRLHHATLLFTARKEVYSLVDEWASAVSSRAQTICSTGRVPGMVKRTSPTEYDVCVAITEGPLQPPGRDQLLWSPRVTELVTELKEQAVVMAQLVVVHGLGPDEGPDHGHDRLDEIADLLRQAMRDHLEGDTAMTARTATAYQEAA